ncbi:MAG: transcription termination factor NusA [Bulleidia sp.]
MAINFKKLVAALGEVETDTKISEDVIVEALKEAYIKAYKKTVGLDDINVEAELNSKSKSIDIYQLYDVVEDVEDDELQMDLEEARKWKKDAVLNDKVRLKIEIDADDMSRAAASLARNVLRQKIREAEKIAVYNAYIDLLDEMVIGVVDSVKDKFALINLGKTIALMPRSAQMPNERLIDGQRLRVVITEVNKDSKGSQVLVSRADAMLVKRLFEKEVPEISQGIVEIKAIARDAGERTKMAVVSYNEEVDPIGACIGQRGSRVQEIIEELHGEKIDIFQWSDDMTLLVKNALAPAEIRAVLPGDDERSLLVVVDEDQLSLAIGKKGKNARLAVKLTNRKIDIKTRAELEAMGKDYDELVALAKIKQEEIRAEQERRAAAKKAADKPLEDAKHQELLDAAKAKAQEALAAAGDEVMPEEMMETLSDRARDEVFAATVVEEEKTEPIRVPEKPAVSQPQKTEAEEEAADETVEKPTVTTKKKKVNLEEMAQKNDYVSVFEKLADTSKARTTTPLKKRPKRKAEEDSVKLTNAELMKQLAEKNKHLQENVKPIYSEEELAEIEAQQEAEEDSRYDIDYDEYEDYYKDEESGK